MVESASDGKSYLFDLRFLTLFRGMEQFIRAIELKAQQNR